jgi:hypothetical protein
MSKYQMLLKCAIYAINDSTTAKSEMLDYCRNYFVGNTAYLKAIHAFGRSYRSTHPAYWYTKDSFIHRIINKSLQLGNIEECCQLRFYIADLSMQIYELKQQQVNTNIFKTGITILYRGLRQSEAHLEILRNYIGHVIVVKEFMSTSRNRDIALIFAGASHPQSAQSQALLLELRVDMKSPIVFAADISHLSSFPEELEVLFDIGAEFHLDTLNYMPSDAIWFCQLTAVTDESQRVKVLREVPSSEIDIFPSTYPKYQVKLDKIMRRERQHKFKIDRNYRKNDFWWRNVPATSWVATSWGDFARIIMHKALSGWQRNQDVGKFYKECKRAWQIYKKEGNNSFFEHKDGANILNSLGYTSLRFGNAERAIKLLEQALETRERLGSPMCDIVLTLRNLGPAYEDVGRSQDALACFTKAINIEEQVSYRFQWNTSMTMRNFGLFFHNRGDHNHAIQYLSKACSMYLKYNALPAETV